MSPGWPEHRSLKRRCAPRSARRKFLGRRRADGGAFGVRQRGWRTVSDDAVCHAPGYVLASLLIHTLTPQSDSLSTMSKSACFVLVLMPVIVMTLGELTHTKQTIVTMTRHMESLRRCCSRCRRRRRRSAFRVSASDGCGSFGGSMVFLAWSVILVAGDVYMRGDGGQSSSDRTHLTRGWRAALRGAVCWLLGVSFTVFLGAMSLQGDNTELNATLIY